MSKFESPVCALLVFYFAIVTKSSVTPFLPPFRYNQQHNPTFYTVCMIFKLEKVLWVGTFICFPTLYTCAFFFVYPSLLKMNSTNDQGNLSFSLFYTLLDLIIIRLLKHHSLLCMTSKLWNCTWIALFISSSFRW